MSQTPYTKKQEQQYRGPSDSNAFNESSEDTYRDLVYLYNKANELDVDMTAKYSVVMKDTYSLSQEIEALRLELLDLTNSSEIYYTSSSQKDEDRFIGGAYEVTSALTSDPRFGIHTLPKIDDSSISRLVFNNANGKSAVPTSLEMKLEVDGSSLEADSSTEVQSSSVYEAVLNNPGAVWERNVISDDASGYVQLDLMFNLPADLSASETANVLNLVPFPMYGVDLLGIYFTSEAYPDLATTGTTWTPLNKNVAYENDTEAVGSIAPGAWSGDEIISAGPLSFVFPNEKMTAMRITLRQNAAYNATSNSAVPKQIYTYGLSHLDVRYDKFHNSGKAIFKLEPKVGETISSISSVTPYIYNVPQAGLADVFSYRIIWETSVDSGTYTVTPVSSSEKVWLEVTLQKDAEGNLPVLNGFKVIYS